MDEYVTGLVPSSGFFLCRATSPVYGAAGPLLSTNGTLAASWMAVYRGAFGSMIRRLTAQILSHSSSSTFLDAPCMRMYSRKASTVMPRRRMPAG